MIEYYINLIILFAVYSLGGYVLEVVYTGIRDRKIVNRGFLKGCFCPIYGFSAVFITEVSSVLNMYINNRIILILSSIIVSILLVTVMEYITGFILEKMFCSKWWDYSDNFANIKGYICLKYSVLWGGAALLLLKIIHPIVLNMLSNVDYRIKIYTSLFFMCYFIGDTLRSVIEAAGLRDSAYKYI